MDSNSSDLTTNSLNPHFSEVRIENTNRCTYRCFICPREKMVRPEGLMSLEELKIVLNKIGDHYGSVDLHGFGEPLLDKHLSEKISLVKNKWPKSSPRIISTLGLSINTKILKDIVLSGLSTIEVSFYGYDEESYQQVHGSKNFLVAKSNLELLVDIKNKYNSNLEIVLRRFPSHNIVCQPNVTQINKTKFDSWLKYTGLNLLKDRSLHNFGNGRNYNDSVDSGCSIFWGFRKRVLQVTWDMYVIPCCFDYNATIKFGNLKQQSLNEIFESEVYRRFINAHKTNDLKEYPICETCEKCKIP